MATLSELLSLLLGVWILELRESGWPDVWLAAM
eukprot:COSAG01_NODE_5896_length_3965_cov_2.419296_1_plen_32_part_10